MLPRTVERLYSLDYHTIVMRSERTGESEPRPIKYDLTTEMIIAAGKDLAQALWDLSSKQGALADIKAAYKKHIEKITTRRESLTAKMLDAATDTEYAQLGTATDLAYTDQDLRSVTAEAKSSAVELNGYIAILEANIEKLRNRINNGFEMRLHTCHWYADYETNTEYLMFDPLFVIVDERSMPQSRKQRAIVFEMDQQPEETGLESEEAEDLMQFADETLDDGDGQ